MVGIVNIALALVARTPGVNLWADLVTGLSQASLYTGAIAAGFAALEAGRWAPAAAPHLAASARAPVSVRALHAIVSIAPIVGGYLTSLLVLGTYGAVTGAYGSPYPPWLIALGGGLVLASAAGYSVGSAVGNRWFVAPAAAIGFYALFVVVRLTPVPFGAKSLYPVVTTMDSVFDRHLGAAMWGQTAFFLGLSIVLILIVKRGWRPALRAILGGVCVLAAAAAIVGAGTVLATNGQYTTGYNSRDFVCTSGPGLTTCLNRGYASAMPLVAQQFEKMNEKAAGTGLMATKLEQNVEGIGDAPAPDSRSVYIEQVNRASIAFSVYRYVEKYGGSYNCRDSTSYLAHDYVDVWLSGDKDSITDVGDLPGLAQYRKLEALTPSEANSWFQAHFDLYLSCRLSISDLP